MTWLRAVARWPRAAQVATTILAAALLVVSVLWSTGHTVWHGPWDTNVVGSLGEWASGVLTAAAILAAYWQFTSAQKAERETEHRLAAARVTAWATWHAERDGQKHGWRRPMRFLIRSREAIISDPRTVRVMNGGDTALFDWAVHVVPSRGWDSYIHFSAAVGPLHPGEHKVLEVRSPPADVVVRQLDIAGKQPTLGPPRYVVFAFTDAWGNGWVRTNGDLQRVPRRSLFLPCLVHLRSPLLPWGGVLDEWTWRAFRDAAGPASGLPATLDDLLPDPQRPFFGREAIIELNRLVQNQRLRARGTRIYTYQKRDLQRPVALPQAFSDVRAFFEAVAQRPQAKVLFILGG